MTRLSSTSYAISLQDVQAATTRIAPHTLRTPCPFSERLSQQLGCELFLKAENLQHVAAFKARGAVNAVLALSEDEAPKGVVTHSSGNHAAALARAATIRGIPVHVVMPENSATIKIEAVRAFGVEPVFCKPTAEARAEMALGIQTKTGATMIHPYNHPLVMAGQGTVGLEILEQVESLDAVVAPIGGGGLMSGILTAIKGLRPEVEVFAAEPEYADDAFRSMQSGKIEWPNRYDTIADGLRTPLGENTFPIVRDLVDGVLLVKEQTIRTAMRELAEVAKLVAEPSGAVALAALKENHDRFRGRRVAVVISGGNIDFGGCQLGHV